MALTWPLLLSGASANPSRGLPMPPLLPPHPSQVDVVIDETPNGDGGYNISDVRAITVKEFAARLGLAPASDFPFLAPGQERVYNMNGRIAETTVDGYNGKDWWQGALVRPDQVCKTAEQAVAAQRPDGAFCLA